MIGSVLAVKLFTSPALIGLASLAGRRWGPNIAGLMGGLPLVGGPIIVALWLEHGVGYAREVTLAAPAGLWANIVYMLVVGYASVRLRWYAAIPLGWTCYLAAALLIEDAGLAHSLAAGLAVVAGLWLAAVHLLPQPSAPPRPARLPPVELVARMATAAVLVFTLATVSQRLGPELTGVLSGAPVAAVVIPAFIHANSGRDALLLVLRGFLTGLMGFAVFCLVLGHTMAALGAAALAPALLAGIATGLLATRQSQRVADAKVTPSPALPPERP